VRAMRHRAIGGFAPVVLATIAVVWSVGIFVSGFALPVVRDGTGTFGGTWAGAAVVLGVPAAASLAVWWLLHVYCGTGERAELRLAWLAITLCLIDSFGAGPYALVPAWFMATAAAFTRPPDRSAALQA
jgi:hypothetical protein